MSNASISKYCSLLNYFFIMISSINYLLKIICILQLKNRFYPTSIPNIQYNFFSNILKLNSNFKKVHSLFLPWYLVFKN